MLCTFQNILYFSQYGIHQQETKKPRRTLKQSGIQKSKTTKK